MVFMHQKSRELGQKLEQMSRKQAHYSGGKAKRKRNIRGDGANPEKKHRRCFRSSPMKKKHVHLAFRVQCKKERWHRIPFFPVQL